MEEGAFRDDAAVDALLFWVVLLALDPAGTDFHQGLRWKLAQLVLTHQYGDQVVLAAADVEHGHADRFRGFGIVHEGLPRGGASSLDIFQGWSVFFLTVE